MGEKIAIGGYGLQTN